ncbi:glucuronate isomerase [Subtercola lobariae]|uniref:Uronate isomerase n=1 Tax=Subtercola lobariae TaxID=1588641 RepID=A0A917B4D5_9MICO|nr:glucuronate isomerase [Subtercola lobariae]GGF19608.1 uronate isomerase [Subtercola lobariae]
MTALLPHPDRLFPADPGERDIARRLYAEVADAPIYSPHGHVDARLLLDNNHFPDPAALLITPDHYALRLLHAVGVPLDQLGVRPVGASGAGASSAAAAASAAASTETSVSGREIWRRLCENWNVFLGTPVRYWFETEFSSVFGLAEHPSPASADALYDQLVETLATEEFRPRALFERFRIAVLATTDDPADDLAAHLALRNDPTFAGRVVPTFRADRYMHANETAWPANLERLGAVSGIDTSTYAGLLEALRSRRAYFAAAGATATDTGVVDAGSEPLEVADAERLHAAALRGSLSAGEATAYRHNMLYQLAAMASEDGLVMQLHPGVLRNHHQPTFDRFGPDTGHDLPEPTHYTRPLTPILRDFGTNSTFRLVLFTVDETAFSREIAPLAGFYPSVYAGAPWWFLDSPAGIARYRSAITDSAGFTKTSGFIDDTRAFCSIPARHDMSRRSDAAYLASLVSSHQVSEDNAVGIARRLVGEIPVSTFRLAE